MEQLKDKIVGIVTANGGTATWQDLLDGIEYQERRSLQNAFRLAKADGSLERVVQMQDGKPAVVISIPTENAEEASEA